MSWITPKTNWACPDIPVPADFNRIEGNELELDTLSTALQSDVDAEVAIVADEHAGDGAKECKLVAKSATTALPPASATYNGRFWIIVGGGRTAAQLYFCRSTGATTYAWFDVLIV